ncbi:MAG: glycosyltransferase, partial [Limisphaera sp.]
MTLTVANIDTPQRLRVLHIAAWYPTPSNPVAGIFIREHVKATALFNDVAVVYAESCRRLGFKPRINESVEEGILTLRVLYPRLPVPKGRFASYALSIEAAYRHLKTRGFSPHIIHAHVWPAAAAAVFTARIHAKPLLLSEHSSEFPRKVQKPRNRRIAAAVFRRCHLVCPVSEYLASFLRELAPSAKITIVPNVIDTTLFRPDPASPPNPSHTKRILLVALLSRVKGIDYLL